MADRDGVLRFLCGWWSRTYNRPLKDPMLDSYTLEELMYEFFDRKERDTYVFEVQEEESDKIEEAKYDEAVKWADAEEAKEKDAVRKLAEQVKPQDQVNAVPTVSPEDEAWMRQQLNKEHQEVLGEDIVEEF